MAPGFCTATETSDMRHGWYICKMPDRGFHKISPTQKRQYCHLYFSSAISNLMDQKNIQPGNVFLFFPVTAKFVFTNTIQLK